MNIITLTPQNLESEHICCAITSNKDPQVASKKAWLSHAIEQGLLFQKCDVRGKCFIESIPAENAWVPVSADGYQYVNCFWVSGQWKGHGYANQLLEECIQASRKTGKKGLVILSSDKKRPYLSDPGYLLYKGFSIADTAEPYFHLLYLPFSPDAPKPFFLPQAKHPSCDGQGFTLTHTHQCPFTAKYVPLIEAMAKQRGAAFRSILLESAEQAKAAPCPFTTYGLFYNGEFITHEILSEKKFDKILTERGY